MVILIIFLDIISYLIPFVMLWKFLSSRFDEPFHDIFERVVERKRKVSCVLVVLAIVFLYFGSLVLLNIRIFSNTEFDTTNNKEVADGFTIDEYQVELNVYEDCSVNVYEYIDTNFYETGHHGIYRSIPYWLKYTNRDGDTESREAKIRNVLTSENCSESSENGRKIIKIGDAGVSLPVGEKEYGIKYTYDLGNDPYEGYDEFIFHVFGDYWGTRINKPLVIINLPKKFDPNDIHFFADKYRQKDITQYVNYEVEDNSIVAQISDNYELNGALTVDVVLPDNYFINAKETYGSGSITLNSLCIIFIIVDLIVLSIVGIIKKKLPEEEELLKTIKESHQDLRIEKLEKKHSFLDILMLLSSVLAVVAGIVWPISYFLVDDMNPKHYSYYWIALVCSIFTIILSVVLIKINKYSFQYKNYLQNKIKNLYIKKYKERKTSIGSYGEPMSPTDFHDKSTDSSSSGCSSCGGGCSSCGGGGSW